MRKARTKALACNRGPLPAGRGPARTLGSWGWGVGGSDTEPSPGDHREHDTRAYECLWPTLFLSRLKLKCSEGGDRQ